MILALYLDPEVLKLMVNFWFLEGRLSPLYSYLLSLGLFSKVCPFSSDMLLYCIDNGFHSWLLGITSENISRIKAGAELGEFRLMLILQMCALSSVVLHPSPKLVNLLYPIPGKGSANHLIDVNVKEADHHDALRRVSHHFNLKEFGDNGGESFLCETLPGRRVFDAFFRWQSLFLLNALRKAMRKKYSTTKWITVEDEDDTPQRQPKWYGWLVLLY